ncbi:MAG: glycosyltransferase family 2 protein [Enterococcus sp.]|nr:glycosyltransferase family 2 protein [Enterococcus sp.]
MKPIIIIGELCQRLKINQQVYTGDLLRNILNLGIRADVMPSAKQSYDCLMKNAPDSLGTIYTENQLLEKKYDLKIIIPAYNAEEHIEECLNSVIKQETTFTYLIEVINDGSQDSTEDILEGYRKYPNLNIIKQDNKGFSGSRNTALKNLCSKYILFLDSDDYLEKDAIQNLLSKAFLNDSDIVEGGYKQFKNNGEVIRRIIRKESVGEEARKQLYGYPWGKVYKSELFQNLCFPEGYWFEDTIMQYTVYPKSKKITIIPDLVYNYRYNLNGITVTSKKNNKSIDSFWVTKQILNELELDKIEMDQTTFIITLQQFVMNFRRTKQLSIEIQKSLFIQTCELVDIYFLQSFKLEDQMLTDLFEALKERNFKEYYLICSLYKS